MLLRHIFILALVLSCMRTAAQQPDEPYYPYALPEERRPMLRSDTTIFYRAIQTADDIYGRNTDFNLPRVGRKRRGAEFASESMGFAGLEIGYRDAAALRLLRAAERRAAGAELLPGSYGGVDGARRFEFDASEPLRPYRVSVRTTNRNYRVGARIAAEGPAGESLYYRAAADAAAGRDARIGGVFTETLTAAFRLSKRFANDGEASVVCLAPLSKRGLRSSAVAETFQLTGDKFYNPAWGFQNGKERNARVRREFRPTAVVTVELPVAAATRLAAACGVTAGFAKVSGLEWYDARTPQPDNYRYLPSYTGDAENYRAWRDRDARYTQVRWDELIARNEMNDGPARFTVEDRVERPTLLQVCAELRTRIDARTSIRYGAYARHTATRCYKQMRDLLGAHYATNTDRYLIDDATYGNALQNDLRNPDRRIGPGDRFSYDYTLTRREVGLRAHIEHHSDRLRLECAATWGATDVFRTGHYEKQLFPGSRSYGSSKRMRFMPYALHLLAGWCFSPRHYLGFALSQCAAAPDPEALFYQPLYNNLTAESPVVELTRTAEIVYRTTGPRITMQATAYIRLNTDAMRSGRHYDDLSGFYCDRIVSGIGTRACGIEAAAEWRVASRWSLQGAASAGRYEYVRDPVITVISDTDNTPIDTRAASRMGGCRIGGAPQLTAVVAASYFGPGGWGARFSAGYAGARYIEPEPLRRTFRYAQQGAASPETSAAFVAQECLKDALTTDLVLFKSFYFGTARLLVTLAAENLAGSTDVYAAYESPRVMRLRAGDATLRAPHPTRYLYDYGRTFRLTVSYEF